ncbi:MAG TPA: pyridoxamine 5'-phosphate oxidase family protein [Blastocatellia bacterium]|nr:pyridoxamine 5'-phosphate oxidase family protein [Blastocatellia bacterium]
MRAAPAGNAIIGDKVMIEVVEMRMSEIEQLLDEVNYGHLGCSQNGMPYVVPVHFAWAKPVIYIYTTEGKKAEIIRGNPKACLQLEDVKNKRDWRSVIVQGEAAQVTDHEEREKALKLVAEINPTLTPAVSIRWMDSWVRENIEVILKLTPTVMTGRFSVDRQGDEVPMVPAGSPGSTKPQ